MLSSLVFSASRVENVKIQISSLVVSCILSSESSCLIQYSMVLLAWVKLKMNVLVSESLFLSSIDVGSSGRGQFSGMMMFLMLEKDA